MRSTVTISKEEYNTLKTKAKIFDHFIEIEELNKAEVKQIKNALKGPFLTKSDFLKKHPELA